MGHIGRTGWREKKSSAANQNQSYNSEKFPADEKIERVARFNEMKI